MTASAMAIRFCVLAVREQTPLRLPRPLPPIAAPFSVIEIDEDRPRDIYGYDLLLLRPDLHVVWRGNGLPDDPEKLTALVTGH